MVRSSSGRNVAGCCTPVVPDVGFFAVFSAIAEWFSGTCGWASQSQRDCSYQPRVARDELPGVSGTEFKTLKGLDRLLSRWDSTPSGLRSMSATTQGRPSPSRANLYMFFSMADFPSVVCAFGESPLGGLWNEGERSEPSGTTRPAARGGSANGQVGVSLATFRGCLRFPLLFSLLRQGTEAGAPAQGVPAVCASSFNLRTVCSQSVAQHEPRTSSAPNSNRCLNGGSGRKFACIRLSQITLTRH